MGAKSVTSLLISDLNKSIKSIKSLQSSLERTKLSDTVKLTTYELGKRYEDLVVYTFNNLRATVKGYGGVNDAGIDFLGSWKLSSKNIINVVGQCKNYQEKSVGPSVLREFEGVMSRHDTLNTFGIIATPTGFTKSAIETLMSSRFPIGLLVINFQIIEEAKNIQDFIKHKAYLDSSWEKIKIGSPEIFKDAVIKGFLWNTCASKMLQDLIVTPKYKRTSTDSSKYSSVSLIYKGKILY
ncbi:hypothetical protein BB560_001452 [Smittium megazygosporum]|uniref:Restriction endonuclease type IV Mrr domain-containing protein n=1 Tax=Smittium megazygosporum TaxID=133381 RepID=A0A2T9ZHH7_9FUNG|nr:hypothetical protein BB560_001452 [Smittium megazygosporum]